MAAFDNQAVRYDERAGLPEQDCRAIVQAVLTLAAAQPGASILELGAGTGQIGTWFVQSPLSYIGLDASSGMLKQFRQRLPDPAAGRLVHGDGNDPWPVDDHTVAIVFSSRALHWLSVEHIVSEVFRVASKDGAGALLIIGRVRRGETSVAARMQREMRRRLKLHGFEDQSGDCHQRQLLERLQQLGGEILEPVTAARFSVIRAPQQSLQSWQGKSGLAGVDLPAEVKQAVLDELQDWALSEFGNLQQAFESEEFYRLQGVRIRPPAANRDASAQGGVLTAQ